MEDVAVSSVYLACVVCAWVRVCVYVCVCALRRALRFRRAYLNRLLIRHPR
jgi:hypothetical protein